jgi:phosphoenolpyruvate carboxykinase (ATP)
MEGGQKIELRDTLRIIEGVVRGQVRWRKDEFWGYDVAEEIPGLDLDRFDPAKFYSEEEIQGLREKLKRDRLKWLSEFTFLEPEVVASLNP